MDPTSGSNETWQVARSIVGTRVGKKVRSKPSRACAARDGTRKRSPPDFDAQACPLLPLIGRIVLAEGYLNISAGRCKITCNGQCSLRKIVFESWTSVRACRSPKLPRLALDRNIRPTNHSKKRLPRRNVRRTDVLRYAHLHVNSARYRRVVIRIENLPYRSDHPKTENANVQRFGGLAAGKASGEDAAFRRDDTPH